jgi:hypothetical protein
MPRSFTLLRTLGRGAHGTVHLAALTDDDDWQQTVAVKQLLPEWSRDPDLVARLKDEARLLALLQHDHVVRVYGLTRIEGNLAILMEPIEGTDLGRLVATQGTLPPRVAVEIVEAVADALDAAWEAVPAGQDQPLRVVHRDIKPSNVMVTTRGGVKVMDFGVARASFEAREVETRSQQYGTARYMAPERWLSGLADHRSDVFSLGITLAELCTGRAVARPRLVPALFAEDLRAAVDGLPEPLSELVLAMTRFDPVDRLTGRQVVERCRALLPDLAGPGLREWSAGRVVPAPAEPLDATAPATVVQESPLPTTEVRAAVAPTAAAVPRRAWLAVALATLAVFLAVPRLRRPAPEPPPPVVVVAPLPPPAAPVTKAVVVAPPPEPPEPPPPAPSPVPPVPRPAPPPPEPAPEPTPAPAPAVRLVPVRFVLAGGLTATTDFGALQRSPTVLSLPANHTVLVTVTEGARTWTCTIHVSAQANEVRIRPFAEGRCSQS